MNAGMSPFKNRARSFRRCRLHVVIPTGAVGFTITTGNPFSRELERRFAPPETWSACRRRTCPNITGAASSPIPLRGTPMQPTVEVYTRSTFAARAASSRFLVPLHSIRTTPPMRRPQTVVGGQHEKLSHAGTARRKRSGSRKSPVTLQPRFPAVDSRPRQGPDLVAGLEYAQATCHPMNPERP